MHVVPTEGWPASAQRAVALALHCQLCSLTLLKLSCVTERRAGWILNQRAKPFGITTQQGESVQALPAWPAKQNDAPLKP